MMNVPPLYILGDPGPWKVNFYLKNKEARISRTSVATTLTKLNLKFDDIMINSRGCATAILRSMEDANKAIQNESMKEKYDVKIPHAFVFKFGVVKDLDLDEDFNDNIKEIQNSNASVCEVKQLTYRDKDGAMKPSHKISLKFRSNELPTHVFAYGLRLPVHPFMNKVKSCSKCGRLNHETDQCKSVKQMCTKCYGDHEVENCDKVQCKNCKGPHLSNDKNCPAIKKQEKVNKIVSKAGVSFKEAKKIFNKKQHEKKSRSAAPNQRMEGLSYADQVKSSFPELPRPNKTIEKPKLNPISRAIQTEKRESLKRKLSADRKNVPTKNDRYIIDFSHAEDLLKTIHDGAWAHIVKELMLSFSTFMKSCGFKPNEIEEMISPVVTSKQNMKKTKTENENYDSDDLDKSLSDMDGVEHDD